ncbi:hypothetical protein JYU34_001374 [Plutella xylostella]|uniref:Sec16 Sec23-binding domain-containing protein n=1 Tax=Plutella xylostella TaxID=51655 RepID=A0ABQ7R3S4_PLUXY|nr:hypothetical protein JYU34_001374 [Plutella xylostella]
MTVNSLCNGNVSALDINPYQNNLLASGASDSEIFIWDLNNTSQPMAPGSRSQPHDLVQALAWNQQVQHILGSTISNRCVVWDLRKNEPIMKLSDGNSRSTWRALAWHPEVATQVVLAGDTLQLWDLRLAASPLVTLEGHSAGVTSVSWCRQDAALLLSAGQDGQVLCWDPRDTTPGGKLLTSIASGSGYCYSVSWCPRAPALLASCSAEQHVALHSLLQPAPVENTSANQSNIMDSFGGVDSFNQLPAVARAAPAPAPPALPVAPAWLKCHTRAKFAFGGKLVTFGKNAQEEGPQKLVYVSQVVSDPSLLQRSEEVDAVICSSLSQDPAAKQQLAEYCRARGDAATDQTERYVWFFLRASFLPNYRQEALNLLGYKEDEIPSRFKGPSALSEGLENNVDSITSGIAGLSRGESTETDAELSTDTSTDLSEAHTLLERKLSNVDSVQPPTNTVNITSQGEDTESLICRALVCGNLEEAAELCLDARRTADALVIASLSSPELFQKVLKYHLNSTSSDPVSLLTGCVALRAWRPLGSRAAAAAWRPVAAHALTHAQAGHASVCEQLGDKLSKDPDPAYKEAAAICFALAHSWRAVAAARGAGARAALAALIRRAAVDNGSHTNVSKLDAIITEYAARLAAQGGLQVALSALQGAPRCELRDRLQRALRQHERAPATPQPAPAHNRPRTVSSHSQKRASAANVHADINNTYNTDPWGASSVPAPAAPPPRPGSVGPQGAGTLSSRGKYKVDPSVQAAPSYGQYGYAPAPAPAPAAPYGGYNSPLPDQYGSNTGYTPMTAQPLPVNNTMNGGGYYSPAPAPPAAPVPAQEPPARAAAPGWNDPPMLTSKPKPKQEVQAQAPITHPLFGVEPPQHIPLNPQFPGQNQQFPGQNQQFPGQNQQFPGQNQQFPGQNQQFPGQPGQFPGQQPGFPGQPQYGSQPAYQQPYQSAYAPPAPEPVAAPEPPAPIQKGPIPDEHVVLQTVLDQLRSQCAERAANPHMKRKLDDVQKRLENLYDMLREYRLSETALTSLHSCVQFVQSGDYGSALNVATGLATGADFAIVASFLPGLKQLLQLAGQLQVYVR